VAEVRLPDEYSEFVDVFLKQEVAKLPKSTCVLHAIPIKKDQDVPYGSIYPLAMNELRILRDYIKTSLIKG
jgi:hypothetical protein